MKAARPAHDPEMLGRAHIVPFGAFMAFLLLLQFTIPLIGWKHPLAPWWRQDPAQFIYPLQVLVVGFFLIRYWKYYTFDWSLKWSLIGVVFGAAGIGLWLLPTTLYDHWHLSGKTHGVLKFFGVAARKEGFDPGIFQNPIAYWSSLTMRFIRAAVVVALVEEIFWRGFLMRFISNRKPWQTKPPESFWESLLMRFIGDWDGDCWKQPFGRAGWRSWLIVTGLFVIAHGVEDRPAALLYGSLTYLLCVWSKNLGACVIMHATANFLMGLYVMAYGKYGLW